MGNPANHTRPLTRTRTRSGTTTSSTSGQAGTDEDSAGTPALRRAVGKWSDQDAARFYEAAELPTDGPPSSCTMAHQSTAGDASGTAAADAPGTDTLILASCHSTWIFDTAGMRFRRILHEVGQAHATGRWRRYYQLVLAPESESFVVVLNAEGTSMLRSWRHTHDCAQCGGHVTADLDLDELRNAVGR